MRQYGKHHRKYTFTRCISTMASAVSSRRRPHITHCKQGNRR